MPEGKLTELEHYKLTSREMELSAMAEKEARMMELQRNANLTIELAEREILSLKSERANAILRKSSLFKEIGQRLEAVGDVDSWDARLDPKNPEKSILIWKEALNDGLASN